jgi:hypothetical protein
MKWSQAICASILVDEFYLLSPHTRSKSRSGRDVIGVPLEPAFRPSLFTADWGLPRSRWKSGPRKCKLTPHKAPDGPTAGALCLSLPSRAKPAAVPRLLGNNAGKSVRLV